MTREQFIDHVKSTEKAFRRFLVALCCGDTSLADDIAQEAYIKAYVASETLKNPDKFKSWIFKIGYTTFINHKRAEKTYNNYDDAREIAASESTDSQFQYQELYYALNKLPHKERTSVLLFYMEGYSIKEIADIEQTSQSAVKQHLLRGRNHLHALMSNSQK
ncbi:MAG: RNA polymerase sigma factor [Firmicutes bacterium]|nr:RNA polymerase sigma factor [Bacillota bacterium]MCM1400517.1 RNA polymerase sigma factor [Bacteroides sp.]MCM1476855.1 RNA polymerase sigma factor [Bacteroides sp.]